MRARTTLAVTALVLAATIAAKLAAQGAPPPPPSPPGGAAQTPAPPQTGRGNPTATFPAQQRPPADPALVTRGKNIFEINCRACHGGDLRGGDMGGPNLLRSPIVLGDQEGELMEPIIRNGRPNSSGGTPMPPFPSVTADDVKALAAYIHSVAATMRGQGSPPAGEAVTLNIVVGTATAGQAYFAANCASCHSATGDLKGIAARITDPMQLQNAWVSGNGRGAGGRTPTPVTVTVTMANGQKAEGRLQRIDDFLVVLVPADGRARAYARGPNVKVDVHDPLEPHIKLLARLTDKDMHDVTAYLVTLK